MAACRCGDFHLLQNGHCFEFLHDYLGEKSKFCVRKLGKVDFFCIFFEVCLTKCQMVINSVQVSGAVPPDEL